MADSVFRSGKPRVIVRAKGEIHQILEAIEMQPRDIKKLAVIFTVTWLVGSVLFFSFLMFASYYNIRYTAGRSYVILNNRLDTMEASHYHASTLIGCVLLTVLVGGFLYGVSWIVIGLLWFTRQETSQPAPPPLPNSTNLFGH